ncbi:hypothetical protein SteCoe_34237 [Stentor coeruleus]|uniref:Major facilitator superfamily (MFS) profile domain-containing protein n=1 Tax=Stentor coeruleus TaxID=5963 RepID=A0A1R2AUY2_9CILI|nr:hypothetical protein SteCoe_34237 [Stentor coeruleus]
MLSNDSFETKCIISEELAKIGWGTYQKWLFFNCFCGMTIATIWIETTAILISLDCYSDFEKTMLGFSINFGTMIGTFLLSSLIGHYGREKIFKLCIIIEAFGGVLCLFNGLCLYFGLFVIGFGAGGDFSIGYPIFIEGVQKKYRNYTTLLNASMCFGSAFGALFMLILLKFEIDPSDTIFYQISFWTIVCILLAYLRKHTIESPIYLYETYDEKVYIVMEEIARKNSQDMYLADFPMIRSSSTASSYGASESIFSKGMIVTTASILFLYFFSSFSYYSMLFYMPTLLENQIEDGDESTEYKVIFGQQLISVFGVILSACYIDSKIGRVGMEIISFFIAGVFTFFFLFVSSSFSVLIVSAVIIGCMMSGISTLYTHTQELYPALLRGKIGAWSNFVLFSTGVITPITMQYIDEYSKTLGLILIAFSFVLSSLVSIPLKETKGFKDDEEELLKD